jgi:hypothetical protein
MSFKKLAKLPLMVTWLFFVWRKGVEMKKIIVVLCGFIILWSIPSWGAVYTDGGLAISTPEIESPEVGVYYGPYGRFFVRDTDSSHMVKVNGEVIYEGSDFGWSAGETNWWWVYAVAESWNMGG